MMPLDLAISGSSSCELLGVSKRKDRRMNLDKLINLIVIVAVKKTLQGDPSPDKRSDTVVWMIAALRRATQPHRAAILLPRSWIVC
jgi:hypothetical protein